MSLIKILFKAARKAGPAALLAVVRYGPELRKLVKDNPRMVESMTKRFRAVAGAKEGPSDKKGLHRRVEVLHEQVTYVYASANTSDVARQAAKWREELERIDHAIPIVESMSRREQAAERKKLVRKLDEISASVLAATVEDAVEDAQIVEESDEEAGAGDSKGGKNGGAADDDGSAKNGGSARNGGPAGSDGSAEKGGAGAN